MITRYRVWLDGLGLQDIDPAILITDVQENAPKVKIVTAGNARYDGSRVTRRIRQSLSVTVRLMIRTRDAARRSEVLSKVTDWAHSGKYLTVNHRPGQRLRVEADTLPTLTSALKWTEELSLTFTAYQIPYWQEEDPVSVTAAGTSGSVKLTPMGQVPCFLEAKITHTAAAPLNQLRVEAGGQFMELTGLNLAAPAVLAIAYDDQGLLTLPFACRTPQSCDDLVLTPNEPNPIAFTADQSVTITFSARGLYL